MKIISVYDLPEEIRVHLLKENGVIESVDGYYCLFKTDETFNVLSKKYNFEKIFDECCVVEFDNFEEFIECIYEEDYLEYKYQYYLRIEIPYHEYYECAIESIEYMIKENKFDFTKWDKEVEEVMKSQVMLGFKIELEKALKKMKKDGFDLSFVEDSVSDVMKYN